MKMKKSKPGYVNGIGREAMLMWNTYLDRCPWCLKKRGVTHLELYSVDDYDRAERAWSIVYPKESEYLIGVVSHPDCGSDNGYAIPIDELAENPKGWYRQLSEKVWARNRPIEDLIWDCLLLQKRVRRGDTYSIPFRIEHECETHDKR